jgi:cobalt-zinc-cadmium efflux system membrane fusion protein
VKTLKVDVGAQVKKGDPLASIDSAEVGGDRSRLGGGGRACGSPRRTKRKKDLQPRGSVARTELLGASRSSPRRAEADAAAASRSSAAAAPGVGGYVARGSHRRHGHARARPIGRAGRRRTRSCSRSSTRRRVWAELDVPERRWRVVRIGSEVDAVTLDGLAGRELLGTIEYLAPSDRPHTRTAKARVSLANPDGTLRANMFGRARIAGRQRQESSVMVPRAAVQRAREQALVFVKLAKDLYETRHVKLGASVGED